MKPHAPPRMAVALLERVLPDNEPLTGDLLEASRLHTSTWFWRQTLVAVLWHVMAQIATDKRVTAGDTLVAVALLALLGFHAVVAASLINHLLVMSDASWMLEAGRYQRWQLYSMPAYLAAAVASGRLIGRFHREHRAGAILAFGASATLGAFSNLYLFVPDVVLQPFVPSAVVQTAVAMVFIAGLFVGIVFRPVPRVVVICGIIAVGLGEPASAQVASERFDVASIKRNVAGAQQGSGLSAPQPGGRYVAIGATLRRLVGDAYGDDVESVLGGPAWADSERFDVNAKAEGEPAPAAIRRMIRTLLADRFSLAVHGEDREMPVYTLTLARSDRKLGEKLRESDVRCAAEARTYFPGAPGASPPCGDFRLGARSLVARGMTMERLARLLAGQVGRPVVNRTGLDTAFDIELEWSSDLGLVQAPRGSAGAGEIRPDGVSLFTALQELLGLRLDSGRAPVPVLIIDSAETPTVD